MEGMRFTWDPAKNEVNINKHGIAFEEAISVFYDDNGLLMPDPDHSQDEDRFVLLGFSRKRGLLVVCHCYREDDTLVRIYSARKADHGEEIQYYRRN
jgi:uncharacterized DUF497 family protein